MGTNFYARIIPSKSRKEKLKKMIDENCFDDIKDKISDMYNLSDQWNENHGKIHLGKRSGGWKFLFNPNYERYYPLTKEGLLKFLKRDDVIIYTEYFSFRENDEYSKYEYVDDPDSHHDKNYLWTAEQFMNMATNWGYNDPTAWDGKSYEKYEKERNSSYSGYERYGDRKNEEFWIKRGYYPSYYNFYNDGLRWSTCCEFS